MKGADSLECVDLLIRGEVLIKRPDEDPVRDGAVAIRDGVIVDVAPYKDLAARYDSKRVVHRPAGLILPGLVNSHTHAAMTLFRGIADDLPLKTWLEKHIFPAEARLDAGMVALGTELACAEMIRCGTTGFVDMYLFEDAVAEVVDRVGMRAWLGEGLFDFPSPAFPSGEEALKETERLFNKWKDHPRITITVDPHTPYTCGPELLEKALRVAEAHDALVVIHLAETQWEDQEIRKRYSVSPAEHLHRLGLLSDRLLAVHCVALSHSDIGLLAAKGANVAHCPESNLKLASGVAPVPELLNAGIVVSLGTDGAASNNDLDLMSEMDTAAKLPKGLYKDPTLVSASQALSMATTQAAHALGRDDLGELRAGAQADLSVINLDQVHMRPCYDPVSHVVYVARSGDVQDVMVAGRFLMEDWTLTTIDEQDLMRRVRAALEQGMLS